MSKLVAIELENFMSIENARVEFDETGILNLCGYNDSGKSAFTRSIEVLFYDAYSGDQVNFIQDGKEHFGVGVEFTDGVSINKYKYSNGKSVWEMLRGDEIIYTNRLANGISALNDVPEPIAQYLEVIKDDSTDEQLNIRRNTDKLFLINTTGGDNYKILNTVLRADILAESVKRMNEDRNKLQSEVTNLATSSNTLKKELENITVLDQNTFNAISEKSKNIADNKNRVEYLTSISNQKHILDTFIVYDEVPTIDTSRLTALTELQNLKQNTEIPTYAECTIVDISRLQLLEQINQLRSDLDTVIQPEVHTIDPQRLQDIRQIGESYNNLLNATNSLTQVEQDHQQTLSELQALSQQYGFKICKSCGTVAE